MKKVKATKKPIVITAEQVDTTTEIQTLEGVMRANRGDWIILGEYGEKYPIRNEIFKNTYDIKEVIKN